MALDITTNAGRVARELARLPADVERALAKGLSDFAKDIEARASRFRFGFTDRSGALRRSIRTHRPMVRRGRVSVVVSANTAYARYIDRGQRGRYSFLERAARELQPRLKDVVDERIRVTVRRVNDARL